MTTFGSYQEELDALLDGWHEHKGHNVSLTRCPMTECKRLRELTGLVQARWMDVDG